MTACDSLDFEPSLFFTFFKVIRRKEQTWLGGLPVSFSAHYTDHHSPDNTVAVYTAHTRIESCYYFAPRRRRSIAVSMSACSLVYVKTHMSKLFYTCWAYLWPWLRLPLTSVCTSGFVYDVIFSYNRTYVVYCGEDYGRGTSVRIGNAGRAFC